MESSRLRLVAATCLAIAVGSAGCHALDFSSRVAPGEIGLYDDLFAISVVDDQHAVTAGYHGSIYYTKDGGENWSKGESGIHQLLYSVSMADAQHGWVVGQLGTILRTDDGGATWHRQKNLKENEGSHLFGVQAIDANTAWAVGEWGTRILTEDGGKTWVDHSLPIDLLHPMFVWLDLRDQERVRNGEKVYEDVGLNNIFCLPTNTEKCWLIGEFGYIFYSDDRGATWTRGEILGDVRIDPIQLGFNQIEIPASDKEQLQAFATKIADENHLNVLIDPIVSKRELAEIGDLEDPYAIFDLLSARIDETKLVLENAGILLDRLRMPNKPPWDFEDFLEDDPAFLTRYLEGRTREEPGLRISVIQNPFLFTVDFEDEKNGLIAGLGGVVLRTSDAGRTWSYQTTARKRAIFSVATASDRAVAVGEKGLVVYSSDRGITWRKPDSDHFPTVFTFMRDLGFDQTGRVGFIVGQEGMVLRSEDSGATWSKVLPPGGEAAG